MKYFFIFSILILAGHCLIAQTSYTKNGNISFFSKTNLEDISAENDQVMSTLDVQTGQLQFSVLVKAFRFKKSLMEEHFNENYLESDKFPKATFKGNIKEWKIDLSKDGSFPVSVAGDLTIHGVTNSVNVPATITIKNGIVTGNTTFNIKVDDYKISIPKLVKDNIAETIKITVSCVYDKKK